MATLVRIETKALYTHKHIDGRITEEVAYEMAITAPAQLQSPVNTIKYLESLTAINELNASVLESYIAEDCAKEWTQKELEKLQRETGDTYVMVNAKSGKLYPRRPGTKATIAKYIEPLVLEHAIDTYSHVLTFERRHMSVESIRNETAREIAVSTTTPIKARATGVNGRDVGKTHKRKLSRRERRALRIAS